MRNIQNERAAFAYERVSSIKDKKKFFSLVRTVPSKIQMTGLATTTAFLYSKKREEEHKDLYNIISNWLAKQSLLKEETELMEAITQSTNEQYRAMANEVQQLLIWVKRFAEGMTPNEK